MNLLFNFYFCVSVFVCMLHSFYNGFKYSTRRRWSYASGRAWHDARKPTWHLDGNEVNVSTALPSVPQDITNPFINPNQTLADVIPGRDLGPLSSLKITDADLIIRNLNKELNAAAEKNDNSVALLQRMDQRQKQLESELATFTSWKGRHHSGKAKPYNKSR